MWVPKGLLELFSIGKETVSSLREELAATRAERDTLRDQLRVAHINGDWVRIQINTLQIERTALLDKAYGIKVPVPEIISAPMTNTDNRINDFNFDDVGDEIAKKIGYPLYQDR